MWGRIMLGGNSIQYASRVRAWTGKVPAAERAVGDNSNPVGFAPGEHSVLNGSLLEMIEHLIAREPAAPCDRSYFLEVGHIEITHPPGQNLPVPAQLFEGRDRLPSAYWPRQWSK